MFTLKDILEYNEDAKEIISKQIINKGELK